MVRKSRGQSYYKQLLLLSALPLAFISTGYALFTQSLSIGGTAAKPAYTAQNSMYMKYTQSSAVQGQALTNTYAITVTNKAATATDTWQLAFDMTADASQISCPSGLTCAQNGARLTISSGATNGALPPGQSFSFTVSFRSATSGHVLQNIVISSTVPATFQTYPGLKITFTKATSRRKGNSWIHPYTFTIANTTGQTMTEWRAVCNWPSIPRSNSISSTVNFTTAATAITFTSKSPVATAANFVFTGSFTTTNSTWTISGCTIEGKV